MTFLLIEDNKKNSFILEYCDIIYLDKILQRSFRDLQDY